MQKKYELSDQTKVVDGVTVHRIRRISNGELGGWIESELNLNHDDHSWVFDDSVVLGDARIFLNVKVFESSVVKDNTHLSGTIDVRGGSVVGGNGLRVSGNICFNGRVVKTQGDFLHLSGLMYPITVFKDGAVDIGCETKSIDEWITMDETMFPEVKDQASAAQMRIILVPLLKYLADDFVQRKSA